MEPDDSRVVFSALARLDHSTLKMSIYEEALTMSQVVRADLEDKVARQLRDEVIGSLARTACMDTPTFMAFIQFLSEDPEIQRRFTGWRAARRLTE